MTAAEIPGAPSPIDQPDGIDHRDAGLEAIRRQSRELQYRLDVAEDHRRRTAADLDNLRKRFDREVARVRLEERESVLTALVSLLDDLERVLDGLRDSGPVPATSPTDAASTVESTGGGLGTLGLDAFIVGVESIARRGTATVSTFGYEPFGEPGDIFDPAVHHVIGRVSFSDPGDRYRPPAIVAVAKPGYGTPQRLLRPAAVIVAVEAG